MAKKKQLNEETEYYSAALKIALKLDKDAMVVWHDNYMVVPTQTGTVHIPCHFSLNVAVKASELVKAFKGCDKNFVVTEQGTQVVVEWGNKRAVLNSRTKVSVYARPRDALSGQTELSPQLTEVLRDTLKDLPARTEEMWSQVIKFDAYHAYWTDRRTAAQIATGVWMPPTLLWVKDLRGALQKDGHIVALFGSAQTVTFYWQDGIAIQLPLADDSTVKFPECSKFFAAELHEAEYELTEDHLEAFDYVAGFAESIIFIEPNYIGTAADMNSGTTVLTEGLPLQTQIFAESVKLGALKNAKSIIKVTAAKNSYAFMTKRDNFLFILTRARRD